jgi:hypothetical protein
MSLILLWPVLLLKEIVHRALEAVLNIGCAVLVAAVAYMTIRWVAALDAGQINTLHPVVRDIVLRVRDVCAWATHYAKDVKLE